MAHILLLSVRRSHRNHRDGLINRIDGGEIEGAIFHQSGAVLLAKVCASQAYETFANEREE
jgi:hypothetical protein